MTATTRQIETELEAATSEIRSHLIDHAERLDEIERVAAEEGASLSDSLRRHFDAERERLSALIAEMRPSRPDKPDPETKLRRLLAKIDDDSSGIWFGPDDHDTAILEVLDHATELGLAELWVVAELARGLRESREELGPLLRVREPVNR